MQEKKIAVLGAGISGLCVAYYLKRKGFTVTVYEKSGRAGGLIDTEKKNDYLLDKGIISGIETTSLIPELVDELGLRDSFLYAGEKANLKQAYIGGRIYDLSMNPNNLLKFPLFTYKTKLRFFFEPFLPRTSKGEEVSVADFIKKRLGKEFLDYVIEPFSAEVYAGDPKKLNIKAAYPKLFKLEQDYGSIIKGFKKAPFEQKKRDELEGSGRLFSFKQGMSQLTESLASNLNLRINYLHDILKISHKGDQFELQVNKKGDTRVELFDFVISTLPAGVLSDALGDIDKSLAETLDKVEYAPLTQVYVSYLKQDLEISTKGYTVLIPAIENREVLNITHVSGLFEGRCPGDRHLFSVIMGGNRNGDLTAIDQKEVNKKAIATLSEIFKAKDKPVFVTAKSWKKGVPQYGGEYFHLKEKIEKFEEENRGIFISGNFSGGVSIGDSILNAYKTSERVARFIQQN